MLETLGYVLQLVQLGIRFKFQHFIKAKKSALELVCTKISRTNALGDYFF